jgi:hypothetical protein
MSYIERLESLSDDQTDEYKKRWNEIHYKSVEKRMDESARCWQKVDELREEEKAQLDALDVEFGLKGNE